MMSAPGFWKHNYSHLQDTSVRRAAEPDVGLQILGQCQDGRNLAHFIYFHTVLTLALGKRKLMFTG